MSDCEWVEDVCNSAFDGSRRSRCSLGQRRVKVGMPMAMMNLHSERVAAVSAANSFVVATTVRLASLDDISRTTVDVLFAHADHVIR